jgi:multidrug resistance efflux pump
VPESAEPAHDGERVRAEVLLDYLEGLASEGAHQEAHVAWHIVQIDVPDAAERLREDRTELLAALAASEAQVKQLQERLDGIRYEADAWLHGRSQLGWMDRILALATGVGEPRQ